MAVVKVNQGESIDSALRRFKRKVMTEEIIKDAKKHAFFMPPGQKAKLKSALARKRNRKEGRTRPPRDLLNRPCCFRDDFSASFLSSSSDLSTDISRLCSREDKLRFQW